MAKRWSVGDKFVGAPFSLDTLLAKERKREWDRTPLNERPFPLNSFRRRDGIVVRLGDRVFITSSNVMAGDLLGPVEVTRLVATPYSQKERRQSGEEGSVMADLTYRGKGLIQIAPRPVDDLVYPPPEGYR